MKVFVWKEVPDCGSGRYHAQGGIVVFAENLERATAVAADHGAHGIGLPDDTRDASGDEAFYVFPDAGCC
jgi:hypothetical protein